MKTIRYAAVFGVFIAALVWAVADDSATPKHREPTKEEQIGMVQQYALQRAIESLQAARQAGIWEERLRCEQIYDVEISSGGK